MNLVFVKPSSLKNVVRCEPPTPTFGCPGSTRGQYHFIPTKFHQNPSSHYWEVEMWKSMPDDDDERDGQRAITKAQSNLRSVVNEIVRSTRHIYAYEHAKMRMIWCYGTVPLGHVISIFHCAPLQNCQVPVLICSCSSKSSMPCVTINLLTLIKVPLHFD